MDKADVSEKAPEPPTQSDDEDFSDGLEDDLAETGLLPSDDNMQGPDNSDAASSMLTTDSRANDFVDENMESMDFSQSTEQGKVAHMDNDNVDTGIADTSTENEHSLNKPAGETWTASTDSQDEHSLNKPQGETSTSSSDKTDSQDEDNGYRSDNHDSDDSDVLLVSITVPDKCPGSIVGKVQWSRWYKCYLCGFQSEKQVTFVTHFLSQHPGLPYQCDFCQETFKTCDSLSKHEHSHQYLCYKCDLCGHKTQFPYQIKAHYSFHSGQGLLQCDLCECKLACKLSKIAHQKTHTTKLTYNQCDLGTSKMYTSHNSLRLHTHGKHGPGWAAPCGTHFIWKSQYTRHVKAECMKCIKLITQA